jgi:uncharacterized protein
LSAPSLRPSDPDDLKLDDPKNVGRGPGPPEEPAAGRRGQVGLRVAFYFLLMLFVMAFATTLVLTLVKGPEFVERLSTPEEFQKLGAVLLLLVQAAILPFVFLATLVFAKLGDKKRLVDLGFGIGPPTGRQVAGAGALALIVWGAWHFASRPFVTLKAVAWSSEDLEKFKPFLPLEGWGWVVLGLGFLGAALVEEIIFRGYVYSTLRERFAWVNAAGLTTVLFIAFHATPAQIDAVALINTFLIGMVLAAVRERCGSIWPGALFQCVWNLTLACVLARPLSGLEFPRTQKYEITGPTALTGGAYGPEASWLLTGFLLLILLTLAFWLEDGASPNTDADKLSETS